MKIGTETNSLVNAIYSNAVIGQPEVEIGMGATLLGWTDRHAATIVGIGQIITVKQDNAKVVKGSVQNGSAEYEYSPNPDGARYHFKKDKHGRWKSVQFNPETKRWNKVDSGYGLSIGRREEYYDPHF